jgi:hypothetical protein
MKLNERVLTDVRKGLAEYGCVEGQKAVPPPVPAEALQRGQDLARLAPKCGFIPAQSIERHDRLIRNAGAMP